MTHTLVHHAHDFFLSTLNNKTCFTIILALQHHPKNVTQLTAELPFHQTTISHSLRRLLDCGFVMVEKNGKQRVYDLNKKTIKPLLALMNSHVEEYCKQRCCG